MAVSSQEDPSGSPARPSRRQATRSRLRESGLELFAARGLHGVTTHDIAHHAGLAAGTFYLHFADKQALFREIVLEALHELRSHLDAAGARADSAEQAVRARAAALLDFAERNRGVIRVLFAGGDDSAALEHDVLNTLAESLAKSRLAHDRVPSGVDPAVLGQALVGMLSRVLAWWVEDPTRARREDVIETLTHVQLHGTQPDRD